MKNILLERFTSTGVEIFSRELSNKVIVKIVIYNGEEFSVREGVEIINSLSITKGIGIEESLWLLGNVEMRWLSRYEGVFLSILSRYDIYKKSFTSEEMLEHYYYLVNYWINKIKDIEVIFSLDIPHVPSSFALYIAAKLLKVPHIYLDFSLVYNRYQFFGCSFRNRTMLVEGQGKVSDEIIAAYHDFEDAYKKKSPASVSKYVNYLETRVERLWWRMLVEDINSSLPLSIKALFNGKVKFRNFYTDELGWKISRRRWKDLKSNFSRASLFFAKLSDRIKIISARKRYRKLCEHKNDFGSYIFFAAPMEPEAAILPVALEGRYIFYALKSISESLPDGVTIVYKEHPGQFDQQVLFTTEWKSKFYYENLKELGNIKFVQDDTNTQELISGSIGVATLNGTIGLEAVLAGRHCITFANQWYEDLDGIHFVKNSEDISVVIEIMMKNITPIPNAQEVNFHRNYVDLDGCNTQTYTEEDFKKICYGMWNSYNDFLGLDDRKWEI